MTPLLGWYGDDFTGATDTLAVLTQASWRAMLFLDVPDARQQAAAARALGGALQAVGIAGSARAMPPTVMEAALAPVGDFFAQLGVPVLHYKVCSTFDSAPHMGNIATAVRVLRRHVDHSFVPIVGGQPNLGRYCVFSNLFAAAGRGGAVERIDRHPTMRQHPVTPMTEADLRRHLAAQGLAPVAALHYPLYAQDDRLQDAALADALATQPPAVLLDVAEPAHLASVGRLMWRQARRQRLLAVGPSSVAQALAAHWRMGAEAPTPPSSEQPLKRSSTPVLVFAGSLSPVTAQQVAAAGSFERVAIDACELLDPNRANGVATRLATSLHAGHNVLAYTAPARPGSADTSRAGDVARASAALLRGLLRDLAARGPRLQRVGIAGGDTSSLTVQALDLWGLSYHAALGPGVTVSRAHADNPVFDGVELMLKGGQMGGQRVFEHLLGAAHD
jgi:uncharacterized protein YgbK (DUF1537 family)